MQERSSGTFAREVGRVMQALARTARARQLYSPTNAAMERMLNDLRRNFDELLNRVPELSLRVRAEGLYLDDVPVLEETNPEDSVPLAFYRDGVRRLDFSRGLDAREVLVLVTAVSKGFAQAGLGDDIVSYLWQHDLEHLRYLVVDTTIVDAGAAGGPVDVSASQDLDTRIDGLLRQIYGDSQDDVGPRSLNLDGSELAAKALAESFDAIDELAPGFHPPRAFVDEPAYLGPLRAALEREGPLRLAARAVNTALHALHAGASGAALEDVLDALLRIFDAALMDQDVRLATRIVSGVRSLPRPGRRVEAWLDDAISETRLRQITTHLASTSAAEAEHLLLPFLRAAGPRAVPIILTILPAVPDPGLRRALSELSLEFGISDLTPVREMLTNEQGFVANEALFILSRLDGPAAANLRREAEMHPRAQVRLALLEMLHEHPPEEAAEIALRLVRDPEPKVRAGAARALGGIRTREVALAVEGMIEGAGFDAEPLELRRELLRAYASLVSQRALPLLLRNLKRGEGLLASRDAEEQAVLAVDALAATRLPRAIEALKQACQARSRKVREAAHAALHGLKETR